MADKYYIVKVGTGVGTPAGSYAICQQVVSVNASTQAFDFLDDWFGSATSPMYEATVWDFGLFGVDLDGNITK